MARGNVFIRIHEGAVRSFLLPGEPVNELVHDVALQARFFARLYIRNRTGRMSAAIQVNRPSLTGSLSLQSTVFTRTRYAIYVHEGTPRIFPKGNYLSVPRVKGVVSGGTLKAGWNGGGRRGAKPYFTTKSVAGQRANPFLEKGLADAMRANAYLTFGR